MLEFLKNTAPRLKEKSTDPFMLNNSEKTTKKAKILNLFRRFFLYLSFDLACHFGLKVLRKRKKHIFIII